MCLSVKVCYHSWISPYLSWHVLFHILETRCFQATTCSHFNEGHTDFALPLWTYICNCLVPQWQQLLIKCFAFQQNPPVCRRYSEYIKCRKLRRRHRTHWENMAVATVNTPTSISVSLQVRCFKVKKESYNMKTRYNLVWANCVQQWRWLSGNFFLWLFLYVELPLLDKINYMLLWYWQQLNIYGWI